MMCIALPSQQKMLQPRGYKTISWNIHKPRPNYVVKNSTNWVVPISYTHQEKIIFSDDNLNKRKRTIFNQNLGQLLIVVTWFCMNKPYNSNAGWFLESNKHYNHNVTTFKSGNKKKLTPSLDCLIVNYIWKLHHKWNIQIGVVWRNHLVDLLGNFNINVNKLI